MMHKQLFDDAIGEAPPSTVDVDAAIARGRRAARIGRLGSPVVAASAGVVLVTGGVAAVLLSPVADDPSPVGRGQSDLSYCNQYVPTAPPVPAPPLSEQPEAISSRLTGVLGPLVETRVPAGSQLEKPWGYPSERKPERLIFFQDDTVRRGLHPPGACLVYGEEFSAAADVAWNETTGAVRVALGQHGGFTPDEQVCGPSPGQVYCAEQTGANGERILLTTTRSNDESVVVHGVDIAKPDGTWVTLYASNDAGWGGREGAPPRAAEPPLNIEQLLQIGLDPGMTLHP